MRTVRAAWVAFTFALAGAGCGKSAPCEPCDSTEDCDQDLPLEALERPPLPATTCEGGICVRAGTDCGGES